MEKALRNRAETPKKALIPGAGTRRRPGGTANTVLPEQLPLHRKCLEFALLVAAAIQKSFDAKEPFQNKLVNLLSR
jgi:hypothetical protein